MAPYNRSLLATTKAPDNIEAVSAIRLQRIITKHAPECHGSKVAYRGTAAMKMRISSTWRADPNRGYQYLVSRRSPSMSCYNQNRNAQSRTGG